MTLLVLLILAVMWAAVLLPPLLRGRRTVGPSESISSFQRQLSTLQRTSPTDEHRLGGGTVLSFGSRRAAPRPAVVRPAPRLSPGVPPGSRAVGPRMSIQDAHRRRRTVLAGLGGFTVLVVSLAFVSASPIVWTLALVAVVLLGAYLVVLVRVRQEAAEREAKVRYLHGADFFDHDGFGDGYEDEADDRLLRRAGG